MDFLKEIRSLSRAGRQTTDKYLILKDKETILSGNIKRSSNYVKNSNQTGNDQVVNENTISTPFKPKKAYHSAQSSISSPFKTQDRASYYKSRATKDPNPPPGHYEPNFDAIKKYVTSPVFSRSQTQRKKLTANSSRNNKIDNLISKNHQIKKTNSFADMKWMTIQKPTTSSNFNESTILALNLSPLTSSATKSVSGFDFGKQTSRKPLYKSIDFHQEYKPNKEFCMPKTSAALDMNKNLSRNDFYKVSHTPDPYNVNYKLVTKKPVSFDFSKTSPRNKLRKASLPDFMKGPLGWMSLDLISSDSFIFDRMNTCRAFISENY